MPSVKVKIFGQSQESLRQIIKGLAHEVKNPLGGIRGAAQLLSKELANQGLSRIHRDHYGGGGQATNARR